MRNCAVILVLAGSISSISTVGARFYSLASGAFLIVSGIFMVVLLPIVAPVHQDASFVFFQFFATDMVRATVTYSVKHSTQHGIICSCSRTPTQCLPHHKL